MMVSYVHCQVIDLSEAVRWFDASCGVTPTFSDGRLAMLPFGELVVILDRASTDSVVTIGFMSVDGDADCRAMVARGAVVLEAPQNRPYGARVAYLKGPGALTIELEPMLPPHAGKQ